MESVNSDEATKQQIRTSIKKIAGMYNLDIVEIVNCTVVSVDKVKRNCIVTPLSGKSNTNIDNVGLMMEVNDGELKVPSVGSTVGVVISTLVEPYLIGWSDLDEWYLVIGDTTIDVLNGSIKFGDGSFEGLVKVVSLTQKINNLESLVNSLVIKYNLHIHVGVDSVTTAPITISPTVAQETTVLVTTTKAMIQNGAITHGLI